MSFTPLVRCNILGLSNCDTLEQFISYTKDYIEQEKSKLPTQVTEEIRSRLLFQTEFSFPKEMKLQKSELQDGNGLIRSSQSRVKKLEDMAKIEYAVTNPPLRCNAKVVLNWYPKALELESVQPNVSTTLFNPINVSTSKIFEMSSKMKLRFDQQTNVSDRKLDKAILVVNKLTTDQLNSYGYEFKGNKIVLTKERVNREQCKGVKPKQKGRPILKSSRKSSKNAPEAKQKKPSSSCPPTSSIPKYKSSRLCRGEEFTLFQRAPNDCIRFLEKYGNVDIECMFPEEEEDDCDPFKDKWVEDESFPITAKEMLAYLKENVPMPVIKSDEARRLQRLKDPFSLSSIIQISSRSESPRTVGVPETEPQSRGRQQNEDARTGPARVSRSPNKGKVTCAQCKAMVTKRELKAHFSQNHPNDSPSYLPTIVHSATLA